jgi:hypothetical protein
MATNVNFQVKNGLTVGGGTTSPAGLFSPAANTLAFSTNNIERLRVDSSGNVGIGTPSPGQSLDVIGSIRASSQLISTIPTGIAPLSISSTTLVNNLNADLLDGLNSASSNTASTIVARDASGNFSAGTITAALSGNASTATTLQTARTLWGQSFDGSGNITGNLTSVGNITGTGAVTLTATSGTLSLSATGSNIITIITNSTERIRIDSLGNLGIGTTNPSYKLDINSTDAIRIPIGGTSQRPTATAGLIRYNSDLNQFEGYGTAWGTIGGGAVGGGTDKTFYENSNTITTNYTITTGNNAMTAGPVTINSGAIITVPSGSTWTVV